MSHTYMLILPPLLIQVMNQFNLDLAQISLMATICSLLFGVMAFPGGILADRWGYRVVLIIFFMGMPASACVIGSARSPIVLGIGLALLGALGSLYHPAGLAMISQGVRERGKALGLHGMAGNIGLAFSPIIAGGLALWLSWRYAYYILSLPGFAAGVIFIIISRTLVEEEGDEKSSVAASQNTPNKSQNRFTIRALVILYGAMALTGFCYRGVVTMLPTYLGRFSVDGDFQRDLDNGVISEDLRRSFSENETELSPDAAISLEEGSRRWRIKDHEKKYTVIKEGGKLNVYGRGTAGRLVFATMVYLVGMMGQYMGGHFSDRRRKTRLYLLFNTVSLPFLFLIGLIPGIIVVSVAALFALFHFANQPVENSLVAQYTPPRLRSSSYGLKFLFAFGFGSFGASFSGYIASNYGFNSVFYALAGVILLVVLVVLVLNMVAREAKVETPQ